MLRGGGCGRYLHPHFLHHDQVIEALELGKDVNCEKPIALLEGVVQEQSGERDRLEKAGFLGWVLMDYHKGAWRQLGFLH